MIPPYRDPHVEVDLQEIEIDFYYNKNSFVVNVPDSLYWNIGWLNNQVSQEAREEIDQIHTNYALEKSEENWLELRSTVMHHLLRGILQRIREKYPTIKDDQSGKITLESGFSLI